MSGKVQVKVKPDSQNAPALAGILQRKCACGTHTVAGGECESCQKEKAYDQLQRTATSADGFDEVPGVVHEVLRSSGQPLDAATRSFFEPRFGHDFSQVRVHTGAKAAESAQAVNALAYTVGRDVVFAGGQYAPHTFEGQKLLAHELSHVLQQSQGGAGAPAARLKVGTTTDPSEAAADYAAQQVLSGETPHLAPAQPALRRQGPPKETPLPPMCHFIWKDGKPHMKCEGLPVPSPLPKDTPTIPLNPKDWPKPGDIFKKGGEGLGNCGLFPGFKPGTAKEFKGLCCLGIQSAENCCPPWRIAFKDLRCCKEDEAILDGKCVKSSTIPTLEICLPQQKTLDGHCCLPPFVPEINKCVLPSTKKTEDKGPVTPKPTAAPAPASVEIFFQHDRPQPGQTGVNVLTDEGKSNLPQIAQALRSDPTLKVQLIGMCSIEGDTEYNYALGQRRVEWLAKQLGTDASRLTDAPEKDLRSECRQVRTGLVSCGSAGAESKSNPRDRRVLVRFFRTGQP
ncbi:MAG: DUF4157 domain-containing protein [Pyrinomonadaceae bacterium]|nr:DUF4157 domain-containing protein [Pyrinomonadaceae bacterium]